MSKEVDNVKVEEGILSYTISRETETKEVIINLKQLIYKKIVYQDIYFVGGNNIVLFVKLNNKGIERVFRISIDSISSEEAFNKEVEMIIRLYTLGIGLKSEYNTIILDDDGKPHTFSLMEYCKYGSVFHYINENFDDEKKKSKIDDIFAIVKKLIENNIYCFDLKFANFVVNDEEKVKIIDVQDCYTCDFSTDFELIYETLVYIQIFSACPKNLIEHFITNLVPEKIYYTYEFLHENDKIYSDRYFIILLKYIFWYYRNKINTNDDIMNSITNKLDYEKYCLFLVFSEIIKHFDDSDHKTIFLNFYQSSSILEDEGKKHLKSKLLRSKLKRSKLLRSKLKSKLLRRSKLKKHLKRSKRKKN